MFNPVAPVRNRVGWHVVLTEEAATKIAGGYMKLFADAAGCVWVETITRNRVPLVQFDPGFRMVYLEVDEQGRIVTEQIGA